jgi:hypothetical protein
MLLRPQTDMTSFELAARIELRRPRFQAQASAVWKEVENGVLARHVSWRLRVSAKRERCNRGWASLRDKVLEEGC